MAKMLRIESCGHCGYLSLMRSGFRWCEREHRNIDPIDPGVDIPSWCPLPDYTDPVEVINCEVERLIANVFVRWWPSETGRTAFMCCCECDEILGMIAAADLLMEV